jgi:putative redox protein
MPTAKVKWLGHEEFLATMPSGRAVPFDGKSISGAGPMEILLGALGSCTAVDIVLILEKKRQKLATLEIEISGERAKDPPSVWTKIEMVYRLSGQLEEKAVRDAIELSQNKYCSVAAMLRKTAEITYRFEILPQPS